MDFTRSKLSKQDFSINFVPVYWEPYIGTGEKIVALVATKTELGSTKITPAKAYSVLPEKRLSAMMGRTRGASAHAILIEAADFLTTRLQAGLELNEALPPFSGFSVGAVRRSSGWTLKQVIESAVRSVAAFGSMEDLFIDELETARHTTTTREFLKRIQKSEFGIFAKDRFNKKLKVSTVDQDAPEITIDYCHHRFLVQATSLPSSKYQESDLRQEAESKLFEIMSLQRIATSTWLPKLFVNIEAIDTAVSDEAKAIAKRAQDAIFYFAKSHQVEVVAVQSIDEAIERLESFS